MKRRDLLQFRLRPTAGPSCLMMSRAAASCSGVPLRVPSSQYQAFSVRLGTLQYSSFVHLVAVFVCHFYLLKYPTSPSPKNTSDPKMPGGEGECYRVYVERAAYKDRVYITFSPFR